MLIIHTTDVHGHLDGFDEIVEIAVRESPCLLAVSGDFIDWTGQTLYKQSWDVFMDPLEAAAARLKARGSALAVCAGNHEVWSTERGYVPWPPGVLADHPIDETVCTHAIEIGEERAFVTCFPFYNDESVNFNRITNIAQRGRTSRAVWTRPGTRSGPWIWLHHNPPAGTPVACTEAGGLMYDRPGSHAIGLLADAYEPDLVLCGHLHDSPFLPGGQAVWQRKGTAWSNPGRAPECVKYTEIEI